jgi:hypothetical protein
MASRTTQNQKGNKTMNAMVGNMMAAVVVAAGMIAPRAAEAVGYDVLCPHVKLGKVLGVNREVLKDKSRFPHGESAFPREEVKLDTPVFGFREARERSRIRLTSARIARRLLRRRWRNMKLGI